MDAALRVFSTSANTRIHTFLSHACLIQRAFGAGHAFRSTVRWASNVVREARAYRLVVDILASAVRTTWRWIAWVLHFFFFQHAVAVWITNVAVDAYTFRNMIDHLTIGVRSAQTRTRVLAFIHDTC